MTGQSDAQFIGPVTLLLLFLLAGLTAWAEPAWAEPASAEPAAVATNPSLLERGFSGLYNLDFAGAQKDFSSWEEQHPDDPVGPVSQAAGYLFSEFNRLG